MICPDCGHKLKWSLLKYDIIFEGVWYCDYNNCRYSQLEKQGGTDG